MVNVLQIRRAFFCALLVFIPWVIFAQEAGKQQGASGKEKKEGFKDITTVLLIPLNSSVEKVEDFMKKRGFTKAGYDKADPDGDGTSTLRYNAIRIGRIPAKEVFFVFKDEKLFTVNIIWVTSKSYKMCLAFFKEIFKRLQSKYGSATKRTNNQVKFNENEISEYSSMWRIKKPEYEKEYMIALNLRASQAAADEDYVKDINWAAMEKDADNTASKDDGKDDSLRDKIKVDLVYSFFQIEDLRLEDF